MAVKKRSTFKPAPNGGLKAGETVTKQSFAEAVLLNLGITPTSAAVTKFVAWENQEGGHWNNSALYNPLNTTLEMPGAGNTGTQGNIKVYQSWEQGMTATVKTLKSYSGILRALKAGTMAQFEAAVSASPWGTKFPGGGAAGKGVGLGPVIKPGEHPTGVNVQGAAEEGAKTVAEAAEGFSWEKLANLGVEFVLLLAGAILVVYGIMVAVRPRESALSLPKMPMPVPV
jgi:hypothetical protein